MSRLINLQNDSRRDYAPSNTMEVVYNVTSQPFTCKPHSELVINGRLGIFFPAVCTLNSSSHRYGYVAEDIKCIPIPRFKREIEVVVKWEPNLRLGHLKDTNINTLLILPLGVWYRRILWDLHIDLYICTSVDSILEAKLQLHETKSSIIALLWIS